MEDFEEFLGRDLRLFGVDDEFINKLKWMDKFVAEEVEPLDHLGFSPYDYKHPARNVLFRPLQQRVRDQGLWACHLGKELGGPGLGQFKLACMNIILGRSTCASKVFGTAAPDTGNTEILACYGTAAQKERFLRPLMEDEICSCYSMTELHGGSDPTQFRCTAELTPDGNAWIINGEKLWSSGARYAAFFLVMAATDPGAAPHARASMFIVPADIPGVEIVRNLGLGSHAHAGASHAHMRYTNVRVPVDYLLGPRGGGFQVAQVRLSGGRIHHGMRAIGVCKRAFDMMCERAKARTTQGELLGKKQLVQEKIARSWIELEQFKLLTLRTAWLIDKSPQDYNPVRKDIAAVKVSMADTNESIVTRAQRIHGGLGYTWDLPLAGWHNNGQMLYVGDGPIELHMMTVAKEVMKHVRGPKNEDEIHWTKHNLNVKRREALERCMPKLEAAGVDPSCVSSVHDSKL